MLKSRNATGIVASNVLYFWLDASSNIVDLAL
jgi:hypothetical protein